MKTVVKSSIPMAVWIFFYLQPSCPELKIHVKNVAQDTFIYFEFLHVFFIKKVEEKNDFK